MKIITDHGVIECKRRHDRRSARDNVFTGDYKREYATPSNLQPGKVFWTECRRQNKGRRYSDKPQKTHP